MEVVKKIFGHFFSIVFLPLLLPVYGAMFVLFTNPYAHPDMSMNIFMLIRIFLLTFFFPAFTIILLRALKFINTLDVRDRQERIIPYVAAGFFYIWAYVVFYKEHFDAHIAFILLGSTIAVFVDFLINILSLKVSMHTTGAGGMIAVVLVLLPYASIDAGPILLGTIICAGCIGTARLVLGAHTEREAYLGYLIGFGSFMVAANMYHV
ncbi:MAG: hypothetical protein R2794_01665 [Chitinophagales bacterium]